MEKNISKSDWPLVGNSHIFEFLTKSLRNKNISGSYIFTGPANIGKTTAAHFFAKSLVCQAKDRSALPCGKCSACRQAAKGIHSDIYLIKKAADKKNISIDQIREFIKSLSLSSFFNSYKIGIIKGAENLNESAVSALLKTLEEPKIKVIIILTVTAFEVLPKTIISRSQILRFQPVKSEAIYDDLMKNHGASRSQAKNFSRLCAGRPALALKFLEDKEYYKNYKNRAQSFVGLLSRDINERLKAIEQIIGTKSSGQESVKSAGEIIDIWHGLARDQVIKELGLADLVQYQAFDKELAGLQNELKLRSLLNLISSLKQAKEYISVNVNPKLALENVAVSI